MKSKEIETCREAFDLYVKGYRIEYEQGDPKGYFKEFAKAAKVSPDTITRAVQVRLHTEQSRSVGTIKLLHLFPARIS